MALIAYVNGQYLPLHDARIGVEDRGYQFADGVYEVCLVLNRTLLDIEPHLDRLGRSLAELRIAPPMSRAALKSVMKRLVAVNRLDHATLYLQVTRGEARRDHPFPTPSPKPALVMTMNRFDPQALMLRQDKGVAVITMPDLRWKRCDIKSVSLLGNVLAKQAAREQGAFEAFLLDDQGLVTEGSSTTAFMIDSDGRLISRALGTDILPGITRAVIGEIVAEEGLRLIERPYSKHEALAAKEVFLASTTAGAMPVISIDRSPVGDGRPGPISRKLALRHRAHMTRETGYSFPDSV